MDSSFSGSLSHADDCDNPLIDSCVTMDLNENEQDEDPELCQQFAKIIDSLEKGINPHDEVVEVINLGTDEEKKEVKIIDNAKREEMIALFREYMDVFAWSYKDMPGLDPNIVAHKIPLLEGIEPK